MIITNTSIPEVEYKIYAKKFLVFLINKIGKEHWLRRKEILKAEIRYIESNISMVKGPIEEQMFMAPTKDLITWYMFLVEVLNIEESSGYTQGVEEHSDHAFESARIIPFFATIGEQLEQLIKVQEVDRIFAKLISESNNNPDDTLFELMIAAHYLRNKYNVSFIPENPPHKTPDLLVNKQGFPTFHVECKRIARMNQYSAEENIAWEKLWCSLNKEILKTGENYWIDITFKIEVAQINEEILIVAFKNMAKPKEPSESEKYDSEQFELTLHRVNMQRLNEHFSKNYVKPLTPQMHELIFGNIDVNEKRSTACLIKSTKKEGDKDAVLNLFIDKMQTCTGAQWRCIDDKSILKRAKHFKTVISRATQQFPNGSCGIVHVLYETNQGIEVERTRSDKHLQELTKLEVVNSIGAIIHSIQIYPDVYKFEWAETIQDYSIISDMIPTLYEKPLILDFNSGVNSGIADITHWEQDANRKLNI
ncbi:TPA: hypothetical protein ACJI8U_001530 [Morganella morganii]